ncbi:hypothetical protein GCM10009731_57570 [Streptomyces globosus]
MRRKEQPLRPGGLGGLPLPAGGGPEDGEAHHPPDRRDPAVSLRGDLHRRQNAVTTAFTIREVPDDIARRIKVRAAEAGQSLQGNLLGLVTRDATQPTLAEMADRAERSSVLVLFLTDRGSRGAAARRRIGEEDLLGAPHLLDTTRLRTRRARA